MAKINVDGEEKELGQIVALAMADMENPLRKVVFDYAMEGAENMARVQHEMLNPKIKNNTYLFGVRVHPRTIEKGWRFIEHNGRDFVWGNAQGEKLMNYLASFTYKFAGPGQKEERMTKASWQDFLDKRSIATSDPMPTLAGSSNIVLANGTVESQEMFLRKMGLG